jgi:hypothetical protein
MSNTQNSLFDPPSNTSKRGVVQTRGASSDPCVGCHSQEFELFIKFYRNNANELKAHVGCWCKKCDKWKCWVSQAGLDLTDIKDR